MIKKSRKTNRSSTKSGKKKLIRTTGVHIGDSPVTMAGSIVGRDYKVTQIYHSPQIKLQPKFSVPFRHNENFVGREEELKQLHKALQKRKTVGVRPAMLTGLGGIGKTQLAIEYAYRYQSYYPDGVYWVNAASDWQSELSLRAIEIGLTANDIPETDRRRQLSLEFSDFLANHPHSLLIFDDVEDPRNLNTNKAGVVLSELKCHLLFTTRRRELELPFTSVEVVSLPTKNALKLLLSNKRRKHILNYASSNPEIKAAYSICNSLGNLPLALTLASSYLGKNEEISLVDYMARLHQEGGLQALENLDLDSLDLATQHDTSVTATLNLQWEALKNGDAKVMLQVASLVGEATQIPTSRVALFTGFSNKSQPGYPSPINKALKDLEDLWFIEKLSGNGIRLHPLVRKFALSTIPDIQVFADECVANMSRKLWNAHNLEDQIKQRGVDEVLGDVQVASSICPLNSQERQGIESLFRIIDREAHIIREWNPSTEPAFFLSHWRNRCLDYNETQSLLQAENLLTSQGVTYLRQIHPVWVDDALVRTLAGHARAVLDVVITPDDRFVISASRDSTLRIWEIKSGLTIHTLVGHKDAVTSVAVSSNNRFIASASIDRTLRLWDLSSGKPLGIFKGHNAPINDVIITPDNEYLLSASEDHALRLWEIKSRKPLWVNSEHADAVNSIAITSNGDLGISASEDCSIRLWSVKSGEIIWAIRNLEKPVTNLTVTPDDRYVVTASKDYTLKFFDLETGKYRFSLEGHSHWVQDVKVSPDGAFAISVSEDRTVKVWDLKSRHCISTFTSHSDRVGSIAITHHQKLAVSGSWDRTLCVWDLGKVSSSPQDLIKHSKRIQSITTTSDGLKAITSSEDKSIRLWEISLGHCIKTLTGHDGAVNQIVLTEDQKQVVSTSEDRSIKVWDIESGKLISTLHGHTAPVSSVALTPNDQFIVSGSWDKTILVWERASGKTIQTFVGHTDWITCLGVTPNGKFIVSGSEDRTLRLWEMQTGKCLQVLQGHAHYITALAIAPDGHSVISASRDTTLRIWNIDSGKCIETIQAHSDRVRSITVASNGKFLASGGYDNKLRLWDAQKSLHAATFIGRSAFICCSFTPDNKTIVAGDRNGLVWFFKVETTIPY